MKKLKLGNIISHLFLILLLIVVVCPFAYALMSSFKETREILTATSFLPKSFKFENYKESMCQNLL